MASALDGLERVDFAKGDKLFSAGEKSFFFYIIQEGEVDIFLPGNEKSGEIHLATLGPGEPVGESALVLKRPRSANARAKTDCTVVRISEETYKDLLKDLPSWIISVVESLIERLHHTDEMLREEKVKKELVVSKIKEVIG